MRSRPLTRRVAALVAAASLAATMVVLVTASPASATAGNQTYQYDCGMSNDLAGTQTLPLSMTFDGSATDTADPDPDDDLAGDGDGDTVSHTGAVDVDTDVNVFIAGQTMTAVSGGIVANGGTFLGIEVRLDSASTAITNATPTSLTATGLDPATQVPDTTNGNTFSFDSAIVGSVDASGFVQGDPDEVMKFSGGDVTATVVLHIGGALAGFSPLVLQGSGCTINNQDGILDPGEAEVMAGGPPPLPTTPTGIVIEIGGAAPDAEYATVTQTNGAPTLDNTEPLSAVAGVSQNLTITGLDPDGDDLEGWEVTSASCDNEVPDAIVALVPVGSTTSSATYTFDAPQATEDYQCTFDADVDDAEGVAATTTQFTINVIAGDSTTQQVTLQLNPGVLDMTQTNSVIDLGQYTLTGVNHTMPDKAINRLTIGDGRGVPAGWTLTAQLQADLINPNYESDPLDADYDPNGQIPADHLTLLNAACARTAAGGYGDHPSTAGSGGTLDAQRKICSTEDGQNTGQFTADANVRLMVPGSTYSGTYTAIIEFIVS